MTRPKNPKFFWVPNELIDLYAPSLKPAGIAVYCRLARCPSLDCYPSLEELAQWAGLTPARVDNLLELMGSYDLLNRHDLEHIHAGSSPPEGAA